MPIVAQETMRRPRLAGLTGVRIFAALHIYLFHLKQAHNAGLLTFPALAALSPPLARLVGRGHISTGFFFQLSGFLMAYAYLDRSGRLKTSARSFWRARFLRLYPLYFLSLLLLAPAPALLPFTAKHPTTLDIVGGVSTSLTLTQAWFPSFALWWNAPAWALSAFAAFYAVFPGFAWLTSGLGRRGLTRLVVGLVIVSWLPAVAYLALDPAGDGWTATSITLGGTYLNALRFNPLTWIAQFLAGVAMGRLFAWKIDHGEVTLDSTARRRFSTGDGLALGLVALLALVPGIPYVPLRHGLLAPLTLVVIADIARGRGCLARVLAWPGFGRMSEASFSLFALQMPAGVWFCVLLLRTPHGTNAQLVAMIAWTLGLAVVWAGAVQPLLVRRPGTRSPARSGTSAIPAPHVPRPIDIEARSLAARPGASPGRPAGDY